MVHWPVSQLLAGVMVVISILLIVLLREEEIHRKEKTDAMNQMETLKERIEEEREKLNRLALGDDLEATYRQSLVLDRLVEEYLDRQSA